jgi:hypothetical protein
MLFVYLPSNAPKSGGQGWVNEGHNVLALARLDGGVDISLLHLP